MTPMAAAILPRRRLHGLWRLSRGLVATEIGPAHRRSLPRGPVLSRGPQTRQNPPGRDRVTVARPCGVVFERWVALEEAELDLFRAADAHRPIANPKAVASPQPPIFSGIVRVGA
jgi:hypothetical protein